MILWSRLTSGARCLLARRLATSAFWLVWAGAVGAQTARPGTLRPDEHTLSANGVHLWYRVAGSSSPRAPTTVFLHGGPGYNSYSFMTLEGPRLEPSLRMVYLDQRGAGRSERPANYAYSVDLLVSDLEALRVALGVPQMALIAHSFGGEIALEYAARYPEHVSRMVLVDALSDAPLSCHGRREALARAFPAETARLMADSAAAAAVRRSECEAEFRALPGPEHDRFNDMLMFPDTMTRVRQDSADAASGLQNTGELSQAMIAQGMLQYKFSKGTRLTMPVLIIVGERDQAAGVPAQRELARNIRGATLLVYKDAGHFAYLDQPKRFADDVIAFLTRHE